MEYCRWRCIALYAEALKKADKPIYRIPPTWQRKVVKNSILCSRPAGKIVKWYFFL